MFYNDMIKKSESVFFEVKTENGSLVNYEIALICPKNNNFTQVYVSDELGRNIPVNLEDDKYYIHKISNFKISESIYHIDKKVKIDSSIFLNSLKNDSFKLISKLNNKIILQEDDKIDIYSTKSIMDAERLIDKLEIEIMSSEKRNCLFVKDSSVEQKKYLYNLLFELGYDRKMLYRTSTTHLKDK